MQHPVLFNFRVQAEARESHSSSPPLSQRLSLSRSSSSQGSKLIAAIFAGGLALALAACHAKPVEAPAPAVPEGSRVQTDESSKALPADLYAGMPVYPGAIVEHVHKPKGVMREIMFSSAAPFPDLLAYYKDGLAKGNFKVTSSLIMAARKTWSCDFHREGRPGTIMLYPSDADKSKTTIDLIYEIPQKSDEALFEPREDFDVIGPGDVAQKAPTPNEK